MKVRSHIIAFGVFVRFDDQSMNEQTQAQKEKAWNEGWDAIKNQVPQARKLLEEEFRMLLGATANPAVHTDAA